MTMSHHKEDTRFLASRRGDPMRFAVRSSLAALVLLLVGMVGNASADPVKSPRVAPPGEFICGDVTYTAVSPPGREPVGQLVTANGSNSTSVQIMILDKASTFPQDKLTLCTFTGPEGFTGYFLITPIG